MTAAAQRMQARHCPCGTALVRSKKESSAQWARKKYCSVKCINAGRVHRSVEERFLSNIERIPECGCWIWTGATNNAGYGLMATKFKESPKKAHRVAYELFCGEIPEGLVVRHKCDMPACVNPAHLEIGTQQDNVRDMVRRGRMNPRSLLNLRNYKVTGRRIPSLAQMLATPWRPVPSTEEASAERAARKKK